MTVKLVCSVKITVLLLAAVAGVAILHAPVGACSRVFVNDRPVAKIVARSMDLPRSHPEKPCLVVFPRGLKRDGGQSPLPGRTLEVKELRNKTLQWMSKYGSLSMIGFDSGTTDGLNENGLAVHTLVLHKSKHQPLDKRPELGDHTGWAQYVLDSFKTVAEVVAVHEAATFRVVPVSAPKVGLTEALGLRLCVEDASGDSAIFEYVDGKLVIHHGPTYRVATNDPHMGEMLRRMKKYRGLGGKEPLPGDPRDGEARFARLAANYQYMPDPATESEAVAGAFSLLRIAQVPFRDPKRDPDVPEWAGLQTNWSALPT